ncbi:uncharacterized protein VTP21DRAFT_10799 [Calcarisporiella thermophila]|uniref:uncharacterized protein n=1 Tax=Calcarisporiella thermophila TaxID=911321 RepID=UPI0037438FE1
MGSPTDSATSSFALTNEEAGIIMAMAKPLNVVAISSASLVVAFLLMLRFTNPQITNRVSLRLAFSISLVDIIYHSGQLLGLTNNNGTSFFCGFGVWIFLFTSLLATFLTTMIAVNLQLVIVHHKYRTRQLEKWYYIISVLAALAISLPPYFTGYLGYNAAEKTCWFVGHDTHAFLVQIFIYLFWIYLCVIICIVAVSLVIYQLLKARNTLQEIQGMAGNASGVSHKSVTVTNPVSEKVSRCVRRIILYPVVPIFVQTLVLASEAQIYAEKHILFWLFVVSYIGTSSQGLINAIIFFGFDPVILSVFDSVKLGWSSSRRKKKAFFSSSDTGDYRSRNSGKFTQILDTSVEGDENSDGDGLHATYIQMNESSQFTQPGFPHAGNVYHQQSPSGNRRPASEAWQSGVPRSSEDGSLNSEKLVRLL